MALLFKLWWFHDMRRDLAALILGGSDSPVEAIEKVLGVSSTSMRTVAASAWLLGDPRSQSILDEMAKARLRASPSGASVLADTPVR